MGRLGAEPAIPTSLHLFYATTHPPTRLFYVTTYYHITTHPVYVTIKALTNCSLHMHNKSNPINNILTDMKMTTNLFTKDQGPTGRVYSILGGLGFGIEKKVGQRRVRGG